MWLEHHVSIRHRMMAVVMGTSAVAAIFGSVCYVVVAVAMNWQDTVRDSLSLARITGENCEAALAFQIPSDAENILASLKSKSSVSRAVLYAPDGRRFAAYSRDGGDESPPRGLVSARYQDGALWVSHPIVKDNRPLGKIYLRDDLAFLRQSFRRDLVILAAVTALALLTAYAVARGLVPYVTRPVLRLAETARAVSDRQDYGVRADVGSPDEIGVLAGALNEMLYGIQSREAALRKANAELEAAHGDLERKVRERTAELARSNRDLEQFAYIASHDLQEPLRKVKSFTQLFAQHYAGKLDEQGSRYIEFVVDGAERMQALIQDLLMYSRVSRVDLEREDADLNSVLAEALCNLETAIRDARGVVTADRLPRLPVNARMIGMVLQNLVSNAVKFRGTAPPRVHVSVRRQEGEWTFTVRDNGIGIEPRHFDRLFQIFQRLHTRREYPGTGIGLALCKKVVERHGGRIWVESEPGKGSGFSFTLPERAPEGADAAGHAEGGNAI